MTYLIITQKLPAECINVYVCVCVHITLNREEQRIQDPQMLHNIQTHVISMFMCVCVLLIKLFLWSVYPEIIVSFLFFNLFTYLKL